MSPYLKMMEELASNLPDAWVVDKGWRMIGLPDARMWLKIDVRHGFGYEYEYGSQNWNDVRIDLKLVEGPRHRQVAVLTGLRDSEDAAGKVLQFIESYEG